MTAIIFYFFVLTGVVSAFISIVIAVLEADKSFLKISIPVAVLGIALLIIVPNTAPTVNAMEKEVITVENVGYCTKEEDGSLCPVTKRLYEVEDRENPVLVTKTYHHNFLCFEYIRTEQYLEIPKT